MKAITFQGEGRVQCVEIDDPKVEEPTDAVIRVTASAVCGSDLHVYHGRITGLETGYTVGHEYAGVVESVGADVRRFRPGQRVTGSFFTACGHCPACQRRQFSQCRATQLFGFGPKFGNLPGTQAERARIPFADYTLCALPDELSDEQGLFAGDALSTAFFCASRGGIAPGDMVAVVGVGPVGLLAVQCAQVFGASQVIALDVVAERLALAASLGAIPVKADAEAARTVRRLTEGRGADVVLEAVGNEASLKLAYQIAAGFGTISAAGVFTESSMAVSMGRAFAKDLTLRAGMANIQAQFEPVIRLLQQGRLRPDVLITHRLPLTEAEEAYALFDHRQALKVIFSSEVH